MNGITVVLNKIEDIVSMTDDIPFGDVLVLQSPTTNNLTPLSEGGDVRGNEHPNFKFFEVVFFLVMKFSKSECTLYSN
jgi:hypothetical protein